MSVEKYRKESVRWGQQAEADLKAAEGSLASGSCEWACFQAQQAGEKALKAFWFHHVYEPWGHSLVKLIQDFPDDTIRETLMKLMAQAKRLDKLYIPTRYPNGLPDSIPAEIYTPDDAREAIRSARELLDEIMGAMGGA